MFKKTQEKCKKCNGKGYIENIIMLLDNNHKHYFALDPMSVKNRCKSCKGKGVL